MLRFALPGKRYLPYTERLLQRLEGGSNSRACPPMVSLIAHPRDTADLLFDDAADICVAPDEWLMEAEARENASAVRLGKISWLQVRLAFFAPPSAEWPPGQRARVITPFRYLAQRHLLRMSIEGRITTVTSGTEALVSALNCFGFDVVETGRTLQRHSLLQVGPIDANLALSLAIRHQEVLLDNPWLTSLLSKANEA